MVSSPLREPKVTTRMVLGEYWESSTPATGSPKRKTQAANCPGLPLGSLKTAA
jgi:hypothetical protein